jgi:hypothetical protein
MTSEMPSLRGLRRSALGAWLAVVYALAVLASGLAPSPATALAPLDGAVLCSGLTPPGPDVPEPAGETAHCKGCPVNPVLAGPPQTMPVAVVRASVLAVADVLRGSIEVPPVVLGVPPSRAPPACIGQQL